MSAVPYTVAQQIFSFLYADMMLQVDTNLFLRLALTCKAFKAAVYRHRKALILTQAAVVVNSSVQRGFPDPPEAKNPLVDLDHILADCVQYAPRELLELIERYRRQYERDMVRGTVVIYGHDMSITTATEGRFLTHSPGRAETVLLKDAVFVRSDTDTQYDANMLGDFCEYAIYYDEGLGEPMLWTEYSGLVRVKRAQVFTLES
ncbi:hypothetical protein HDU87_000404 [Geranomyces variabilis]|uniref:Uncharacterized protein n=1 Tax=Geranomyces variabilis TaxID=109894 RepID=A0AAD5TNJ4_9FUNG|nr:hypothetical protein HDU87_000404 [Geranomyces variabilis]